MIHAISVDVEDWYHDGAIAADGIPPRVETNTLRLLEIFESHAVRGTFFFLGEVAERFPMLVARVAAAGHEIGSHGYQHRAVTQLGRREFRVDVQRSLQVIEDAGGQPVRAYRAPYFSIKAGVRWPIETLAELGLLYDSSVLPIDRPPGLEVVCPRAPFRHHNGLWEVPVATLRLPLFWHLPLASGGGLRTVPHRMLRKWIRRFEREVGAGVFYFHPWELDPDSPTPQMASRWWLRVGRRHFPERLNTLLEETAFAPIIEVFADRFREAASDSMAGHAPCT